MSEINITSIRFPLLAGPWNAVEFFDFICRCGNYCRTDIEQMTAMEAYIGELLCPSCRAEYDELLRAVLEAKNDKGSATQEDGGGKPGNGLVHG